MPTKSTAFLRPLAHDTDDAFADLLDSVYCDGFVYGVTAYPASWQLASAGVRDAAGYFVVEGGARLFVEPDSLVDLQGGDYAIVMPQVRHRLKSLRPHTKTLLGCAAYGLDVARARPLLRTLPAVLVLRDARASELFHKHDVLSHLIADLHDEPQAGNAALIRRLTEAAFILSILRWHEAELANDPPTLDPHTLRLAPSLHAMLRRPEKHWTLAALAKEAGVSRSVFCAEFVRTIGETPMEYLTRIRLERARELLRGGALPLATIASQVGYSCAASLGRALKRRFEVSVAELRSSAGAHVHASGPQPT